LPQPGYAEAHGQPSLAIRDERLVCPAAFVGGLISLAVDMVPDIVIGANDRIRNA
jgi:hypothetical protein